MGCHRHYAHRVVVLLVAVMPVGVLSADVVPVIDGNLMILVLPPRRLKGQGGEFPVLVPSPMDLAMQKRVGPQLCFSINRTTFLQLEGLLGKRSSVSSFLVFTSTMPMSPVPASASI